MQILRSYFLTSFLLSITLLFSACCSFQGERSHPPCEDGFVYLFNGQNYDGWYMRLRNGDRELAEQVFGITDGMIHVFDDSFPDEYELNTDRNNTHGMLYTEKVYSKFILRFEYKWGKRIANNFEAWQYDAGVYYHIFDDKIWPRGIEYQVRYNHLEDENHTGDLIRGGVSLNWFSNADESHYLDPGDGGIDSTKEYWMLLAAPTENYNALNDEWNRCEVIVMGDAYLIHKLNGEVVNRATNLSLSEGIIGFQAETAEIFYRNIRVKEFDEVIPAEKFLH
ncbi:MAG: 3-keto-disaccharide hydrolase [Lentimonas sp.]